VKSKMHREDYDHQRTIGKHNREKGEVIWGSGTLRRTKGRRGEVSGGVKRTVGYKKASDMAAKKEGAGNRPFSAFGAKSESKSNNNKVGKKRMRPNRTEGDGHQVIMPKKMRNSPQSNELNQSDHTPYVQHNSGDTASKEKKGGKRTGPKHRPRVPMLKPHSAIETGSGTGITGGVLHS